MSDLKVWAETYRPSKIDDCILNDATRDLLKQFIAKGTIPHLLFCGGPGAGKTTLARAIANELDADLMFINASLESGIDTIRTKVMSFASTVSLSGGLKIILLDEADFLGANSQAALRGIYEEFPTVRFFLTCNYSNKVIDALKSRSTVIEFTPTAADGQAMAAAFFKRVLTILDKEGVQYKRPVVAEVIKRHFPDFRRTLNELQRYSASGVIDEGILANTVEESIKGLLESMKKKSFTEVRKWVGMNNPDPQVLFRAIYDQSAVFQTKYIPSLVLLLADYSFKASHSIDPEIVCVAALTEIMAGAEWN